mgnify:CR=1 FL=1
MYDNCPVFTGGNVAVRVGGGVGVSVAVAGTGTTVCVDPGTGSAEGVAVADAVGKGRTGPLRTMAGATHIARSPVGEPFALILKMNLTFFPASGLKSISA